MDTHEPSRDELACALREAGCGIDLDVALASPAVARCLRLSAIASRVRLTSDPREPQAITLAPWAARIRRLVGNLDCQALRAGPDSN